jgi:ribosomal protein S18 acetylase RimI-like enzyme
MAGSSVKIRPRSESDFQNIVSHYNRSESPLIPFSSTERIRCIPTDGLLVAEAENKFAGFLYWFSGKSPLNDFGVRKYGYISEVFVVKEFYNMNVGLFLLHDAFKRMQEAGLYTIFTHINESIKPLLRLYEDLGFTTYSRTLHLRLTNPETGPRHREQTLYENSELVESTIEIREQCRSILVAYDEFDNLLKEVPSSDVDSKRILNSRIWSRLHSIMSSASIVSKLLWPNPSPKRDGSDKRALLRARVLRNILGIKKKQSILSNDVRNSFEHIDERLIEWLPRHSKNIPWGWSKSGLKKDEEPPESKSAFRHFNIHTHELRVGDSTCNLAQVIGSVREIESHI